MTKAALWTPTAERVATATMTGFGAAASRRARRELADSRTLHAWSVAEPAAFWETVWDFFGVVGDRGERTLADGHLMPGARFFPDAALNFAENLSAGAQRLDRATDALVFRGETGRTRRWSWDRLIEEVSRFQQALAAEGVGQGDRVAGLLPNLPEAIAAMLATISLGAVWSSASPDFGVRGVLDRFGQIEPKVLITADGYVYAGKRIDLAGKLAELQPFLPSVTRCVIVGYLGNGREAAAALSNGINWQDFTAAHIPGPLTFVRLPFDHPIVIVYSSGTTGAPKCIVHRAGVLLQHVKEHGLHADVRPGDRLFYFTTLGWMMWNWLASGLARGATLLLFDGSPFHPGPEVLFDYAADERMTHFGTSAKYLDSLRKAGVRPRDGRDLSTLRAVFSTGSPLAPESFDYVYDAIGADLHLASISGGTDILSCFVLGDPTRPVCRGEIQGPGLGLAMEVRDADGRPVGAGVKGELVCAAPFPAMPLGFWGDESGERYRSAYFDRFPGLWCQGDFAETTEHGGFVIHGRSDATLNPGGVRIGTAEIYAEVEKVPEVNEAVAIGQEWDGDVRVVLFVTLRPDAALDDALVARIKSGIRAGSSPRHVPARIVAVADIPRTKTGKITELAVRDVVHGRAVSNVEALANPEALDLFRDIPALRA